MKTRKLIALLTALLMTFSLFAASASAAYDDGGFSVMSLLPLEAYSVNVTIDRTVSMPYELVNEPRYTVYVRELLADALAEYGVTEPPEYVGYSTSSSITAYQLIGWNDKLILSNGSDTLYFVSSGDQFDPDSKRITVNADIIDYYRGTYIRDLNTDTPENFNPNMVPPITYGEILTPTLVEKKIIPEGGQYNGSVKVGIGTDPEELEDILLTDTFECSESEYFTFILDDGLGTDQSYKRVLVYFEYDDPYLKFLRNRSYNIKTADGRITNKGGNKSSSTYMDSELQTRIYRTNITAAAYDFENGAEPYISLGFSSLNGYTVQVYDGLHSDVAELTPEIDITDSIIGENQVRLNYADVPQNSQATAVWSIDITYLVTLENGSTFFVPCKINVNLFENRVNIRILNSSSMRRFFSTPEMLPAEYPGGYPANFLDWYDCDWSTDINKLSVIAEGSYTNYIMNASSSASGNIIAAYQGHYDYDTALPGAESRNIVNELFYQEYYSIDFTNVKDTRTVYYPAGVNEEGVIEWEEWNLVTIEFSVFDAYGKVYHPECKCAYKIYEPLPEEPEYLSGSTDFYVNYLGKEPTVLGQTGSDKTPRYKIEGISKEYDSYYNNGYRTYLVDDPEGTLTDGTVVYPNFGPTDENISVYLNGEQDKNGILQESGVSPITYENGKTWLYSASAEDKEHSQNYYVTFVAPHKGGSKLFVNAADSEYSKNDNGEITREVVLMNTYYNRREYEHKILIANIGDEPLTGISVTLTGEQGVKLDPYWTVTDGSKATLAPFDGIESDVYATDGNGNVIIDENGSRVRLNGFLQNTAMIKLLPDIENYSYEVLRGYDINGNPVYDETEIPGFVSIAGTLTISADGSEPKNIKLTGIVGNPKIISGGVLDGVKYVPYSSLIQTNGMYGNDNIEYTLLPGSELPDGLEFMPNGEIYGIPKEVGTFTIGVKIQYTGPIPEGANESDYSDTRVYTFRINDNDDEHVDAVNTDDQGYLLTDRVSKYVTVYHSGIGANNTPIIDRIEVDSDLFRSEGSYTGEFLAFYIDAIKLTEGVDYTAEEGSTKITVLAETFEHIGISDKNTPHTLAAEFRNDADELKRSAQNVYLEYIRQSPPSGYWPGSNSSSQSADSTEDDLSFNSVSISMSISDANGNGVPNLALELHSEVQYATSDASGAVKFDNVEFGRHTLYVTDPVTNQTSSKTFTLVSGFGAEIVDDIIVAEVGKTMSLAITLDGGKILFASAQTEVDVPTESAETIEESEGEDAPVTEKSNPKTGIEIGLTGAFAAVALILVTKVLRIKA